MKRTERAVEQLIEAAQRVAYCNEGGSEQQYDRAKEKLAVARAAVMALIEQPAAPAADAGTGEITAEPKHTIREYPEWDKAMER